MTQPVSFSTFYWNELKKGGHLLASNIMAALMIIAATGSILYMALNGGNTIINFSSVPEALFGSAIIGVMCISLYYFGRAFSDTLKAYEPHRKFT